ncbi:MAG: aminomethyl transferase family protein [Verrucomicrobia bacterium]|nr:aminomethyl transferase family protein [Verrucomicrobiota bacterium]
MTPLALHEFHQSLNAVFTTIGGSEMVAHYGDVPAEHAALRTAAGVVDLSARGRLCLLGVDRQKFLNGQVTNNVKDLRPGQGCYAALVSAKGKMHSDLNISRLADELLLDFEPGYTDAVTQRLEKFIIADDVQIVDAAPHYGLLSVQGPRAAEAVGQLGLGIHLPEKSHDSATLKDATLGEIYLMNLPRLGSAGFDLFVPTASLGAVADKLVAAVKQIGGRACGWDALEIARVEAGLPRFGADMDETTLPPEAGLEARAISYTKGCYIGQEVIARIRTYGQVAKSLQSLRLADNLAALPVKGDKLFRDGKEIGFITSAVFSPALKANLALGYVRRECNAVGTELILHGAVGESVARIVPAPR